MKTKIQVTEKLIVLNEYLVDTIKEIVEKSNPNDPTKTISMIVYLLSVGDIGLNPTEEDMKIYDLLTEHLATKQ